MPLFAQELTTAYALVGVMLAADGVGKVLGDVPAGILLRTFGMRRTMLTGLAIAIVSMALMTLAPTIWVAIPLLFVSGIGLAFYSIGNHAYIATVIATERRGRAIGLLGGVYRLGKFIGPLIGGLVAGAFGLRAVFPLYGVVLLGAMAFVWRFLVIPAKLKEKPKRGTQHLHLQSTLREHGSILARAGLGQILAQLTRRGWIVLIPLYGSNVLGLDVQTIGVVVGVGSAMDVVTFYLSGVIMDRFGRKWAIVPSFALQGLGALLIGQTTGAVSLALVAGWIGLANGLSSGTMMTLGADLAPADQRGEFLSVWRLIGDMGFVAGPLAVGIVAQVLVLQLSTVAVAGAGLGAVLVFSFLVPETLKRSR